MGHDALPLPDRSMSLVFILARIEHLVPSSTPLPVSRASPRATSPFPMTRWVSSLTLPPQASPRSQAQDHRRNCTEESPIRRSPPSSPSPAAASPSRFWSLQPFEADAIALLFFATAGALLRSPSLSRHLQSVSLQEPRRHTCMHPFARKQARARHALACQGLHPLEPLSLLTLATAAIRRRRQREPRRDAAALLSPSL
uniref:Uncharacterized protein n=1 Tax=Oryza punctata TaxID=4537 RepID=A0A0E0JZC2_ORYPU